MKSLTIALLVGAIVALSAGAGSAAVRPTATQIGDLERMGCAIPGWTAAGTSPARGAILPDRKATPRQSSFLSKGMQGAPSGPVPGLWNYFVTKRFNAFTGENWVNAVRIAAHHVPLTVVNVDTTCDGEPDIVIHMQPCQNWEADLPTGSHIWSTHEITVHQYDDAYADWEMALLPPVRNWGTDYFYGGVFSFHKPWPAHPGLNHILIQAAFNNTYVAVDLDCDGIPEWENTLDEKEVWDLAEPAEEFPPKHIFGELVGYDRRAGAHISSDRPVQVHVFSEMKHWFGSACNLLPTTSLGREYFVPRINCLIPAGWDMADEIIVVATQPGPTVVNIDKDLDCQADTTFTLPGPCAWGHYPPGPVIAAWLNGAYVWADKKVAVFYSSPGGGHTWDGFLSQMVPKEAALRHYYNTVSWNTILYAAPPWSLAVPPGGSPGAPQIYIFAYLNGTTVNIDRDCDGIPDTTFSLSFKDGGVIYTPTTCAEHIWSTDSGKPIVVYQEWYCDWADVLTPLGWGVCEPGLDIIEESLGDSFTPPDPWVQPGLVEFEFRVAAVCSDLTHVRFFSDPLQHESLPKKIPETCVEFIPQEIGFLAKDDTAVVITKVDIPIGQHAGQYSGYIRAVCCQGYSDSVAVTVHVDPLPDLDIDDDHGNLVANRMELIGHPCWSVVGSYILVNPNLMDNNVDLFDGPGNTDVRGITYTFTDLKGFETGWVIPASQVSHVDSVTSLRCGHAHRNVLQVAVGNVLDDTYIGTVTATGARRSDEFTLALTVTVSGGNPTSGFWGASAPGANELHWTEFDLGEVGFNLYRSQAGGSSFSRLNGSLLEERSYRDQSVFPGVEYQYKLGLSRDDGGELLLGPISLKALGKPPRSYALLQNCPNPFHQRTDIRFGIPVTGHTALRIYDAAGRLVRTLVDEKKEAGYYSVHWNGKDSRQREVASGIYFYSMEAGSFSDTKKMVVLR